MVIFDQQNYSEELGTGHGVTIADSGCALCSVAMLLINCFGISTDPDRLDTALIAIGGFSPDFNSDGNNDELNWGAINTVYSQITLAFNNEYPSNPADMDLIDGQLSKGIGVIVGVSFNHDVEATFADHYVLLYKKNSDNSYQMLDPWYGDDTIFDNRYAVNGMSVAQAILQATSYNGPVIALGSDATGNMFTLPSGQQIDLGNPDSMKVCAILWDAVVNLHQYIPVSEWNAIAADLGLPAGSTQAQLDAAIKSLQQAKSDAQTSSSEDSTTVQSLNTTITGLKDQLGQAQSALKIAQGQYEADQQTIGRLQNTSKEPTSGLAYEDLYVQQTKDYNDDKIAWGAQFTKDETDIAQLKRTNIYYLTTAFIFGYWIQRATQQTKQGVQPPPMPADIKAANAAVNQKQTSSTATKK